MSITRINLFLIVVVTFICASCSTRSTVTVENNHDNIIFKAGAEKGAYTPGSSVALSYSISNTSNTPLTVKNIKVVIRRISEKETPVVLEKRLIEDVVIPPGEGKQQNASNVWNIPANAAATAYGIYFNYEIGESGKWSRYCNFFRVTTPDQLTTFRIDRTSYKGLDVFALHGGMSAECVVEKAAENLKPAIAHSWYLNAPGSGPEHVLSTPQFLQNSVKETVDFYNEVLGENTVFETVVIGPGLEAIPYLSQALKAPVLPIHFLASANTVKEIQSILDYANANGYPSYATLGHDYSVPFSVAWLKLLEMPNEYVAFLKQHKVKNLVFAGYTGKEGENIAKKVANDANHRMYAPGSLFILYPGGGSESDMRELGEKIIDFNETKQQKDFIQIPDWESGILVEQVNNYMRRAKQDAGVTEARFITTKDMIPLWDLATYVSTAFIHKNADLSMSPGRPVKGVSLNPYFVANAFFETYSGFVPLIYWQHSVKTGTIERLKNITTAALSAYFPGTNISELTCWVNSSNNFDGCNNAKEMTALINPLGFSKIIQNDCTRDDIWDEKDGLDSPIERRAVELIKMANSADELKKWNDKLKPLTLEDIDKLGQNFPLILVSSLK